MLLILIYYRYLLLLFIISSLYLSLKYYYNKNKMTSKSNKNGKLMNKVSNIFNWLSSCSSCYGMDNAHVGLQEMELIYFTVYYKL